MDLLWRFWNELRANTSWWDVVGYTGQLVFFSRFIVQWIASERRKESVVPVAFWYLSIIGSLICLVYALTTFRIPFIIAYLFNCIPYGRNLVLIWRKQKIDAHAKKLRLSKEFSPTCDHGDPVVAICTKCGELQCATCARPRSGVCEACFSASAKTVSA
ncbi:lipid-A-disaccharide synthase N-terminal domain-containing protein [bacterium]|nr:lipid-A-disaccharide synthase N-terminal domain-containing protein [bacterium]